MSVQVNNVQTVYETQQVQRTSGLGITGVAKVSKVAGKKDDIALSEVAKEFQSVRQVLQALPDIRQEKVSHIQAQMASGTYSVSSADIANKIIDDYNDILRLL